MVRCSQKGHRSNGERKTMKYKDVEIPGSFYKEWKESFAADPGWGEWEETEDCFETFMGDSDYIAEFMDKVLDEETYNFVLHYWLTAFPPYGYFTHSYEETEIIPDYRVVCLIHNSDENPKYNYGYFIATKVKSDE